MSTDIDYLLEGSPTEVIAWQRKRDVWGDFVRGSRATIAQLEFTDQRCLDVFGQGFEVMQGAYNSDIAASAGTHDFDRCIDGFIPRVGWWDSQRFLRFTCLQFAYYRQPWQGFREHIHMCASHTYETRVGEWVPGQIADYYNHAFGLSGLHTPGSDTSPFPDPIVRFNYEKWKDSQMALSEPDKLWIKGELAKAADQGATLAVKRLLDEPIALPSGEILTVGQVLRRQGQTNDAVASVRADVLGVKQGVTQLGTKVNTSRQTIMGKLDEIDDQVGPPAVP